MAEPVNACHDLWHLGLAPEPAREWDTLALAVPQQRRADLESLKSAIADHPHLKKLGPDYAFVVLADQAAPAKWHTLLQREITATFRTVESRDGMLHLLPDSPLRFQEAARFAGASVRGYYSIMLAYADERIPDLRPLLKNLRSHLAKQPFALAFDRQLQHLRTTPRQTGFRAGPDFL